MDSTTSVAAPPSREISPARALWTLFEPVHAVTYFSPEAVGAFEEAGLRGFWRGYFAGRAAPLGAVGPEPVVASFFSFAPAMVARALPAVWQRVDPAQILQVRRSGATAALRRLLAGQEQAAEQAAVVLAAACARLDCSGRVLAAANAGLALPDDPMEHLWHAATILREHRGDGHVAALVAHDLDGCEVLALRAGIDLPRTELQPFRGWSDEEWTAARNRLVRRGWLSPDGTATERGREELASVERATDDAAGRPWQDMDPPALARLVRLLTPLAHACGSAIRFPNPIGLPEPTAPPV